MKYIYWEDRNFVKYFFDRKSIIHTKSDKSFLNVPFPLLFGALDISLLMSDQDKVYNVIWRCF